MAKYADWNPVSQKLEFTADGTTHAIDYADFVYLQKYWQTDPDYDFFTRFAVNTWKDITPRGVPAGLVPDTSGWSVSTKENLSGKTGLPVDVISSGGTNMSNDVDWLNEYASYSPTAQKLPAGVGEMAGAGIIGALPAVTGAAGALGLPAGIAGLLGTLGGLVGVGAGIFQALGGGEGGGLFGNNLLGGDTMNLGGVEIGGPGVLEPNKSMVIKEWSVSYNWGKLTYWLVRRTTGSRIIIMYNSRTGQYKYWPFRTPKLAVIGKNMPSHKMVVRLRKNLSKHSADARTILKMTSPTSLKGYSKPRRRR